MDTRLVLGEKYIPLGYPQRFGHNFWGVYLGATNGRAYFKLDDETIGIAMPTIHMIRVGNSVTLTNNSSGTLHKSFARDLGNTDRANLEELAAKLNGITTN